MGVVGTIKPLKLSSYRWVRPEDYMHQAVRLMHALRAARGCTATVLVTFAPGALRFEPENRIMSLR